MAARYWIGGTGTWDSTNTANWSATTGGAGGASVPGAADTPTFDTNSGTGTVIFTNGGVTTGTITLNKAGLTLSLGAALSISAGLAITAGTFTTNDYNVTATLIGSSNSNIRTINLGSSTVTLTGSSTVWGFSNSTNATLTGTGIIRLTSATSKSFVGGGIKTYPTLDQAGAGDLSISGNNKFKNITNSYSATGATIVSFDGGSTNTFDLFNLTGSVGKVCTFGSGSTTPAILQKPSAWLMGANSIDQGDNTGLSFTAGGGIDYVAVSFTTGEVITSGISVSGLSISGGVTFA